LSVRVGCHVSIAGTIDTAIDRANALGCNTCQIFTRNPRQWRMKALSPKIVNKFITKVKTSALAPIFAHMPYLPNLASPRDVVYWKSIEALKTELRRCSLLQIPYLVTHLGSHLGSGIELGLERVIYSINTALEVSDSNVMLLLENTAGTRNSIGSTFQNIQKIIERAIHPEKIGVCLDTSHAFAAGYDLRTKRDVMKVIEEVDCTIGFTKVKVLHLNDSREEYNSRIDRHEHIGLGKIGLTGFRHILTSKLGTLPLILETPQDNRRNDYDNLQIVIKLAEHNTRADYALEKVSLKLSSVFS
jgi:deoxyribonuclease-4